MPIAPLGPPAAASRRWARGQAIAEPIGTRPYHVRDFSIRDPNGVVLIFGQDWD